MYTSIKTFYYAGIIKRHLRSVHVLQQWIQRSIIIEKDLITLLALGEKIMLPAGVEDHRW